jgi:hypothetical protein
MQSIRRAIRRGNAGMFTNKLGTRVEQRPKRVSYENWTDNERNSIAEHHYMNEVTAPITQADIKEQTAEGHKVIYKQPEEI